MAKGLVLFGPAGAGKTTLGMMAAAKLNYPYFDFDDYIWRKDTEEPFTEQYPEKEKIERLLTAIRPNEYFVLSGYMDGVHEALDRLFLLAVHINAPAALREDRIRKRDREIYGDRVLYGGDMYETHERFIRAVLSYNDEDQPFFKRHQEWAASLDCPVLYLDGNKPLVKNLELITEAWKKIKG